eukprot:GHVP01021387.1.p1 GENE.GHVP01021387.1~~GHVP01021387.1.p1  ORF type:complete len:408 (+),score=87.26 GHVP01021387.1:392-1615(+)
MVENSSEDIEKWRMKRLLKALDSSRGNGTSMISLVLPPKEQIGKTMQKLTEEYGTATNIKSRVNRLSVQSAIVSAQQRLKLYSRIPKNGLFLYCGTVLNEDGKERKVNIDFEPYKPINTSLYLCDSIFHTEALHDLIENEDKFGVVVVDGHGALFGTVAGNTKEILRKFTVDLPKKHGRGGQSSARFGRLRLEKRHNYVRKVSETMNSLYLTAEKVNVKGLILAGSADFKTDISLSEILDGRIREKIISIVDVACGGENGLNKAIELSAGVLSNLKFVQEKTIIDNFFTALSTEPEKVTVGLEDTIQGLEAGAVDRLLIWESLETQRISVKDKTTGEDSVLYFNDDEKVNENLEVIEKTPFVEWMSENYQQYGIDLCLLSDKTSEGSQFCKGLGGLGSHLRYAFLFT